MAAKKDAEHAHAFDKGTDEDKLAATSEQYQEQTGQKDLPEDGPDPVIEAADKAVADLDLDEVDVKDTTAREQGPIVEESEETKDSEAGS